MDGWMDGHGIKTLDDRFVEDRYVAWLVGWIERWEDLSKIVLTKLGIFFFCGYVGILISGYDG